MNIKEMTVRFSALLGALLMMPGCIAWQIRDELRRTNDTLEHIQHQLDEVDSKMDYVDTTNQILTDMQETSLKHLDEHLASLRKTISNIDSTIPFLKISDDPPEDEPGTEKTGSSEK